MDFYKGFSRSATYRDVAVTNYENNNNNDVQTYNKTFFLFKRLDTFLIVYIYRLQIFYNSLCCS